MSIFENISKWLLDGLSINTGNSDFVAGLLLALLTVICWKPLIWIIGKYQYWKQCVREYETNEKIRKLQEKEENDMAELIMRHCFLLSKSSGEFPSLDFAAVTDLQKWTKTLIGKYPQPTMSARRFLREAKSIISAELSDEITFQSQKRYRHNSEIKKKLHAVFKDSFNTVHMVKLQQEIHIYHLDPNDAKSTKTNG